MSKTDSIRLLNSLEKSKWYAITPSIYPIFHYEGFIDIIYIRSSAFIPEIKYKFTSNPKKMLQFYVTYLKQEYIIPNLVGSTIQINGFTHYSLLF